MTDSPNPGDVDEPRGASFWIATPRGRLLLLAALGLFLPVLGLRDFWYPDEPDIAEACLAMFDSGDWITPRRMGVSWVDYPPMIYWLGTMASHLLGGVSEFSLRLPNALASITLLALVCGTASRWYGPAAAAWAGLVLLTLGDFALQAVSYRPDVLFSLWITAALLLYARGAGDRPRWGPRVAAFAMLGLAMLSKGPLGLLLPGLVLTLWHVTRREWRRAIEMGPLAAIAMAVYLPWFVACARAMGADSILGELYAQNVGRFFSGSRGHEKPLLQYFGSFWHVFRPWSLLFPWAVAWIVRERRWRDRELQLVLWWFFGSFAFLSLAATKRGVYLLPLAPAFALLMAPWLDAIGRRSPPAGTPYGPRVARWWVAGLAGVYALSGIVLLVLAPLAGRLATRLELDSLQTRVARAVPIPLAITGLVLLASALWISRAWRRGDLREGLWRAGWAHVPIYLALTAALFPAFDPIKSYREQSAWLREQIGGEAVFGLCSPHRFFAFRKMGAFGYYSGVHVETIRSGARIEEFLREHPASLVLVEVDQAAGLLDDEDLDWRERVEGRLQTGSHHYWILRAAPTTAVLPDRAWLSRP